MNRDSAAKLWPVIKGFAEGRDVQIFVSNDKWTDVHDPSFHTNVEYRLKPEPKEVWVNEYPGGLRYYYATLAEANRLSTHERLSCKRYIEVMED